MKPGGIPRGSAPQGFTSFLPFKAPANPPPGSYDPQIDAQVRAAGRGLGDTQADVGRDRQRMTDDAGIRIGDLTQQRDRTLADTLRGYQQQGVRQGASAQEQGVARGGTLQAALAARTENQGRDTTRLGEDFKRSVDGVNLGVERGNTDFDQTLTRAGRENTFFGQDAGEQRFFQAGQAGWEAPTKPANEFTSKGGTAYRVLKGKKGNRYRLSNGTTVNQRPA